MSRDGDPDQEMAAGRPGAWVVLPAGVGNVRRSGGHSPTHTCDRNR